ncbi:uncharacterized protein LOC124259407 [Haliotis rubra]|uniref:uncharacterized protein LOC124259407 n=1 Tax=Haliotis rubra TaxID=36100 RepID=UPI001EE53B10|nr:uncharacterized protein LOC124259407 [Haliotis rubra]
MTSYYQYCDGTDVNAIGGGELRAYEFIGDDVEVTLEAFIGNYKTGEGYAYNHVIGHFMSNGSITFTATLDDAFTFIPLYVINYHCKIDSGYFDGEISFFLP